MVDLTGIYKPFIFITVFMGIFALLLSLGIADMPLAFTGATELEYADNFPEYFDAAEVESLAQYHNITADNGGAYYSQDWGIDEGFGHNFLFKCNDVGGDLKIVNEHYFPWLSIPTGNHEMTWIGFDTGEDFGTYLLDSEFQTVSYITGSVEDGFLEQAKFKVACDHVRLLSTVSYNATAYANLTMAFLSDAATVVFAISWDELGTGLSAYSLISDIMTFNRPDVHPALNALIAVPLWAMIGFIIVVIILAIIEALPFT